MATLKALDAALHAETTAQSIQAIHLSTLHDVEDPPQHCAGQRSVRHLGHEEPYSKSEVYQEEKNTKHRMISV